MLGCSSAEEFVEALPQSSTHDSVETCYIVLDAEEVLIGITLGEGLRIGKGVKIREEACLLATRSEEAKLVGPDIAPST